MPNDNSDKIIYFNTKNGTKPGSGAEGSQEDYKYTITKDMLNSVENGFISLDKVEKAINAADEDEKKEYLQWSSFYFVEGNYDNSTLENLYKAFSEFSSGGGNKPDLDKIFNDFLKGNAILYDKDGNIYKEPLPPKPGEQPKPPQPKYYRLAQGITREFEGNGPNSVLNQDEGKYKYSLLLQKPTNQRPLSSMLIKGDANFGYELNYANKYSGLALPYVVLAVFFEKSLIQQDIVYHQIEFVELINKKITENNQYLAAMNIVAQRYYNLAVTDAPQVNEENPRIVSDHVAEDIENANFGFNGGITLSKLNGYLLKISGSDAYQFKNPACPNVIFSGNDDKSYLTMHYAFFNADNEKFKKDRKGFSNIDATEQSTQTSLSNFQEIIRMQGDKASTESQMANTYMQQYLQTMNTTLNLASQLNKTIGDYYKNITNNIK